MHSHGSIHHAFSQWGLDSGGCDYDSMEFDFIHCQISVCLSSTSHTYSLGNAEQYFALLPFMCCLANSVICCWRLYFMLHSPDICFVVLSFALILFIIRILCQCLLLYTFRSLWIPICSLSDFRAILSPMILVHLLLAAHSIVAIITMVTRSWL